MNAGKFIKVGGVGIGSWAMMVITLAACEKEPYNGPEEQPVYFEYHYTNHAWGYQENGWLIDGEGKVRSFNLPEGYRFPDSTGLITLPNLEHNLSLTDSIIAEVGPDELDTYIGYIPGAAEGEIGTSSNVAADAGGAILSCYLYDHEEDAYRSVFLAQSGDWEQFNLSRDAEILVDWLLEFGVFWLSD